jgi:hypothetical protein
MNSNDPGQGPVIRFYDDGDEPSGSITGNLICTMEL